MTPSHANKQGTRYRYYVSQGLIKGPRRGARRGRRVPAGDLEGLVEGRLRAFLGCEGEVYAAIESELTDVNECVHLVSRAGELAQRWPKLPPAERRAHLTTLIDRIDLLPKQLRIRILPGRLPALLIDGGTAGDRIRAGQEQEQARARKNEPSLTFTVRAHLKRAGMETRLVIDGDGARKKPDHSLRRLLAQAYRYQAIVMRNGGQTMTKLAAEAGVGASYFSRILRLSFLAPDIVQTILHDRHPLELNAKRLATESRLPIAWEAQRTLLGTD